VNSLSTHTHTRTHGVEANLSSLTLDPRTRTHAAEAKLSSLSRMLSRPAHSHARGRS